MTLPVFKNTCSQTHVDKRESFEQQQQHFICTKKKKQQFEAYKMELAYYNNYRAKIAIH